MQLENDKMINQLKKQEKEIEEIVCLDISNDEIISLTIEGEEIEWKN